MQISEKHGCCPASCQRYLARFPEYKNRDKLRNGKVIELSNHGLSNSDISKNLGLTVSHVSKILRNAGICKKERSCKKFEPDNSQFIELANIGNTALEIASFYGVSKRTINKYSQEHGISLSGRNRSANAQHENAVHALSDFLEHNGSDIEYVSGSACGRKGTTFKCKEHGHVFSRHVTTVKAGNTRCPECEKMQRESKRKEAKEITSVCDECGCTFTYEYKGQPKKYCCERCGRRARNRRNHPNSDRRRRNAPTGGSIRPTWRKLYEQGERICYLCGEEVDLNDYTINGNGAFIAGAKYPSIEHLVALANGGLDSFDNARIAHCRCNSLKRDIPLEVFNCSGYLK